MARLSNGLIVTETLTQRHVTVDLHFAPSVGILARKFDKLGIDIRSFRVPLKRAIKFVMIPSIRRNFDSGGRPSWEPLAEETVRKKRGKDDPLIRTGRLRRVMSYQNIWTVDTEKAMITDLPHNVWYGKVHQAGYTSMTTHTTLGNLNIGLGGKSRKGGYSYQGNNRENRNASANVPARPFVVMQDEDLENIDRIFTEWLDEQIAQAGLR